MENIVECFEKLKIIHLKILKKSSNNSLDNQ